jgi:hypothetical protein
MATVEERMQILKMIEDGKITAEEGAELLETLDSRAPQRPSLPVAETLTPMGPKTARWFRVVITDLQTGKKRVNLRLPVSLLNAGVKMGARFAPQVEGLDSDQLLTHLRSGEMGKVFDVVNEGDGEHVEVFLE